jgi:hypothetical protein
MANQQFRRCVYRVFPKEIIEIRDGDAEIAAAVRVEQLNRRAIPALLWSLYISFLSTFHFGYKELSVAAWVARAQPRPFGFEATGWLRAISGIQSILCLFLLAMWLLAYFGRPFQ